MELATKIVNPVAAGPKRYEPRVPAALKVRVLGADSAGNRFNQAVTTMDISLSGARITGLQAQLKQGEIVVMQTAKGNSLFKVCWVTGNQDGTYQIGVSCLKSEKCPWRDWLMGRATKKVDRRERIPCDGSALLLRQEVFAPVIRGTLRNIDEGGCFVQCFTESPLVGTLRGQFVIDGIQFDAVVTVCNSLPAIGVRLQWCDLGKDGQKQLRDIVRKLILRQMIEPSSVEEQDDSEARTPTAN